MGKTLVCLILTAALVVPTQPAAALEVDDDLLALVAMPLAVAAVSEITDVPANDLIDMVTLLNDADVPPVQFVEVVRYIPVALVAQDTTQPRFVEVVREREQAGVRGTELVTFIEERLNTYGLPAAIDLDVTAPRLVELNDDDDIVPVVVRTRVAQVKAHPHGGPPGQLKIAGVQTGAEIVHGTSRGRDRDRDDDDSRVTKERKQKEPKIAKGKGNKANKGNKGNKGKGKG